MEGVMEFKTINEAFESFFDEAIKPGLPEEMAETAKASAKQIFFCGAYAMVMSPNSDEQARAMAAEVVKELTGRDPIEEGWEGRVEKINISDIN